MAVETETDRAGAAGAAPHKAGTGIPRWLLIAIGMKLALATAIVAGVLWWASR